MTFVTRLQRTVRTTALSALMLFLISQPSEAEEHDLETHDTVAVHGGTEHEFHRNHFGGFVGVSTHHDTDDAGSTLGLEYARVLSRRWAVTTYLELVSSSLERDVVLVVGGIYYPMRRVGLVLAVGGESVEKDVVVHGTTETESELELLIRAGIAYGFPLTPTAALGPALFVDRAGDRWTTVVGITMVVGF